MNDTQIKAAGFWKFSKCAKKKKGTGLETGKVGRELIPFPPPPRAALKADCASNVEGPGIGKILHPLAFLLKQPFLGCKFGLFFLFNFALLSPPPLIFGYLAREDVPPILEKDRIRQLTFCSLYPLRPLCTSARDSLRKLASLICSNDRSCMGNARRAQVSYARRITRCMCVLDFACSPSLRDLRRSFLHSPPPPALRFSLFFPHSLSFPRSAPSLPTSLLPSLSNYPLCSIRWSSQAPFFLFAFSLAYVRILLQIQP